MNLKPWWKLSDIEKSKRSYWLAPFCLLLLFLPEIGGFKDHWKYTVPFAGFFGFLVQGYIYRRKSNNTSEKEIAIK